MLRWLYSIALDDWHVEPGCSIEIDEDKVPEPDVAIVRGEPDDYPKRPPTAKDVGLIVEISESSLRIDQGIKKIAYASQAIPVYWIVNLVDRRIKVYFKPSGRGKKADYRQVEMFKGNDLVPLVLDETVVARIEASAILP